MDIKKELESYGMNEFWYEKLLQDCSDKVNRINDMDWSEICDKYGLKLNPDTVRKANATILGGPFVKQYMEEKFKTESMSDELIKELDKKKAEIRKEKIKLQTLNMERNRLDRQEARQELFYEYVADSISALPLPKFNAKIAEIEPVTAMHYVVTLADIHYGAEFISTNNEYSPAEFKTRLEFLFDNLIDFIHKHDLSEITIVNLGDTIQGCLRISDVKLNSSTVIRSVVEVSELIGQFLNELSAYVQVNYYHVPTANHSQTRPLGTKAGELPGEDLEFVIAHYIKALCKNNERINVITALGDEEYIKLQIPGFDIYAGHGHKVRNIDDAIKNLSAVTNLNVDYLLLGHFHSHDIVVSSAKSTYDSEILISGSFMGGDPFSDTIMKSAKASVKIYGFDELYGCTETYKIILN